DGAVVLVDQRRLPGELVFLTCRTVAELCGAIRSLAVRGAPALGAAGAMGVALAAVTGEPLGAAAERLCAT
ncbi:MAG: S-methyl-5-thioribose-1-phosphate isomerase, partial [Acidimicrobiia bacterium]